MKQQAINYWGSLKEQEQRLLIIAGVVFIVFVLVMGILKPLNKAVADAEQKLKREQNFQVFVEQSIGKLKAAGNSARTSSGNLSQLVNRSRGRYGIVISQMQPNNDSLRVNIENVEFNKLVGWLDELVHQHGVTVANLDISQGEDTGFVRVSRLVLEK
ncbi:type II secretion system protein GspM [Pseudoalteromonas phenolica]|uniref:Type II secretion system protein M n=1 Tax=Pseudoalteromonas phenolica TaxID=161398 RepID=A0A0S2K513_9GAMM|nr:type II secretion system protein M [Pseudoalteromonas phenolica]ALO43578.1 Type II secretion system protein M [Pseudoalteromonas phenolica]MBE0355257.1 general secretion pathway protein M [Pseudoalteromonas phenolica O-BC30]RXE95248.1 type II secretion system protein M [Pseudoalteromonas phenolica O-BC30]TMO58474.1 type II secretion system protein M [Pseudoalteromonas phenolica]|tara:strand:+ start:412 stop:885 length:474 start_codon:yes stop_codon:yes gene_type:complete